MICWGLFACRAAAACRNAKKSTCLMRCCQAQHISMGSKVKDHSVVLELMHRGFSQASNGKAPVPLDLVCHIWIGCHPTATANHDQLSVEYSEEEVVQPCLVLNALRPQTGSLTKSTQQLWYLKFAEYRGRNMRAAGILQLLIASFPSQNWPNIPFRW